MNGRKIFRIPARGVQKDRGLFIEWPTEISIENIRVVVGSGEHVWIFRIQHCVCIAEEELPVITITTRLCKNLDATVTQLVVLRGKRVLIDTNFANRRFWGKLAAGKSINVNLPAIRTGRRSG